MNKEEFKVLLKEGNIIKIKSYIALNGGHNEQNINLLKECVMELDDDVFNRLKDEVKEYDGVGTALRKIEKIGSKNHAYKVERGYGQKYVTS